MVPHPIAHILHQCPGLIAHSINAIYTRDETGTSACIKMKKFAPNLSTLVPMTCPMTRLLYAQLKSMDSIPSPAVKLPPIYSATFKAVEMGMKITGGFEIMYWNHHDRHGNQDTDHTAYSLFKETLYQMGYFRGLVEGSIGYQQLEKQAKDQFQIERVKRNKVHKLSQETMFMNIVKETDWVPLSKINQEEPDCDEWLFVSPDQVDEMVKDHDPISSQSQFESESESEFESEEFEEFESEEFKKGFKKGDDDDEEPFKPYVLDEMEEGEVGNFEKIVQGVDAFMEKKSGMRGALVLDEVDSDVGSDVDSDDDVGSCDSTSSTSDIIPFTFNPETFKGFVSRMWW